MAALPGDGMDSSDDLLSHIEGYLILATAWIAAMFNVDSFPNMPLLEVTVDDAIPLCGTPGTDSIFHYV